MDNLPYGSTDVGGTMAWWMCEYGCEWVEGGEVENMWAGREWEGLTDGTRPGNSHSAAGCGKVYKYSVVICCTETKL